MVGLVETEIVEQQKPKKKKKKEKIQSSKLKVGRGGKRRGDGKKGKTTPFLNLKHVGGKKKK